MFWKCIEFGVSVSSIACCRFILLFCYDAWRITWNNSLSLCRILNGEWRGEILCFAFANLLYKSDGVLLHVARLYEYDKVTGCRFTAKLLLVWTFYFISKFPNSFAMIYFSNWRLIENHSIIIRFAECVLSSNHSWELVVIGSNLSRVRPFVYMWHKRAQETFKF